MRVERFAVVGFGLRGKDLIFSQESRVRAFVQLGERPGQAPLLSDTMCSLVNFEKSTLIQNRQLYILISDSQQLVDGCVGALTF